MTTPQSPNILCTESESSNELYFSKCSQPRSANNRPFSPAGTISAFNSCPPSPRSKQTGNCSQELVNKPQHEIVEATHDDRVIRLHSAVGDLDDSDVLDWDLANGRENSVMANTLLAGDDVPNITVTQAALLDFHDTDAQLPPLGRGVGTSAEVDDFMSSSLQVPEVFCNERDQLVDGLDVEQTLQNTLSNKQSPTPSKPSLSYVQLIAQAICAAPNQGLPLRKIYEYISKHHPFYRMSEKGWQNIVRHTLSLSPYFERLCRPLNDKAKGSLWTLSAAYHRRISGVEVRQPRRQRKAKYVVSEKPLAPGPAPLAHNEAKIPFVSLGFQKFFFYHYV